MPEGDTVFQTARRQNEALAGLVENYADVHMIDLAAALNGAGSERLLDDGLFGFTHMGSAGWLLQRTVLERGLRSGALVPLLSTFGLAVVLDNMIFERFGADTQSLAPDIGDLAFDSWNITDQITVGQLAFLTFVVAVALLAAPIT